MSMQELKPFPMLSQDSEIVQRIVESKKARGLTVNLDQIIYRASRTEFVFANFPVGKEFMLLDRKALVLEIHLGNNNEADWRKEVEKGLGITALHQSPDGLERTYLPFSVLVSLLGYERPRPYWEYA